MSTEPAPDETVAEEPVLATIKKSAVPAKKAEPAPAVKTKGGRNRGWISGWCSPPCRDAGRVDSHGEPVRRCIGFGTNGINVEPRIIMCSCPCHADTPDADDQ
jgi:hypothetical protein